MSGIIGSSVETMSPALHQAVQRQKYSLQDPYDEAYCTPVSTHANTDRYSDLTNLFTFLHFILGKYDSLPFPYHGI